MNYQIVPACLGEAVLGIVGETKNGMEFDISICVSLLAKEAAISLVGSDDTDRKALEIESKLNIALSPPNNKKLNHAVLPPVNAKLKIQRSTL